MANDALYKLCADNPRHQAPEAIIAKFWIIGRTYAAAIERRRVTGDVRGDDFYTRKLVPLIKKSNIDARFAKLEIDRANNAATNIEIHKWLMDCLSKIAGSNKRSLASKYLHFHFPNKFYIYDSRAVAALRQLMRGRRLPKRPAANKGDRDYAGFYRRCELFRQELEERHKRKFSHREFDSILVAWADRNSEKATSR